jgi:hypothetical protein
MINKRELELLQAALIKLEEGTSGLPEFTPSFDEDAAAEVLFKVAERMQDNYPYYHPQYAGQMLKPPHPVARMAYALSLWVNPNNHALDGGRASSAMEKECIVELGRMFGWEAPLGHLAGGGTMANLEALWVSGRLHPGKRVIASEQAHYTHSRISEVLPSRHSLRRGMSARLSLRSALQASALWIHCRTFSACATGTIFGFTLMRPMAATSDSRRSWARVPGRHSTYWERSTPS